MKNPTVKECNKGEKWQPKIEVKSLPLYIRRLREPTEGRLHCFAKVKH